MLSARIVANVAALRVLDPSSLADGAQLYLLGYFTEGDGGQGLLHWMAGSTTMADDGLVFASPHQPSTGRYVRALGTGVLSVRWFGAKGDGRADDTAPVRNLMAAVRASVQEDPAGGDRVITRSAYFPAGTYLVTAAEALQPGTYVTKARGLHLLGDGPSQSQILFKPATPGVLLNNAAFLDCQVQELGFASDNMLNTFMRSSSVANAVQRWSFDRVEWTGSWGQGFDLFGSDNNSEWRFDDCEVSGEMGCFLHIGPGGNTGPTSDQFLNFWVNNMKFWATAPNPNCFCEFNQGGSIRITNSDFSGLQNGTLFKLLGGTHAFGVCSFVLTGTRFELKTNKVKVMRSEWPQGFITIRDCDFASQATSYAPTTPAFTFADTNVPGALLLFENCSMIGTIEFSHASDDFRDKKSATFLNCEWPQLSDLFSTTTPAFVLQTTMGVGNDSGHRPIILRGCRGGGTPLNFYPNWVEGTDYKVGDQRVNGLSLYQATSGGISAARGGPGGKTDHITDGTVHWKWLRNDTRDYANDVTYAWTTLANPEGVSRRVVSFKNPRNQLPAHGGGLEIILPAYAVIVSARIYAPAGGVTSGAPADYTIATDGGTTVVSVHATPAQAGFNASAGDLYFPVGTDITRRCLRLVAGATVDQYNSAGLATIEFLG